MNFCIVWRFLILLSVLLLSACQSDLYTKLSESDANEMVALLVSNGIQATRVASKDGTSLVRVDEHSIPEAITVLRDAGLPKRKFATIGEVFADTKLISSPTEERARFIYALSEELSKTLSEIDGVVSARVHLVLPRNDPLQEGTKPSSASVFIKHDASVSVSAMLPQIKMLVMNGVEGLTYEKVSVVFVPSDKTHRYLLTQNTNAQAGVVSRSDMFSDIYIIMAGVLAALTFSCLVIWRYVYSGRPYAGDDVQTFERLRKKLLPSRES